MRDAIARLEARVSVIEGVCRRWMALALCASAVLVILLLSGQAAPDPKALGAERIVVTDASGKERIVLGRLGGEGYGLAILDADGRKRLVASVDDGLSSTFLNLRDAEGMRRVAIVSLADGTPGISLRDEKGRDLVSAFCAPRELERMVPPGLPDLPARLASVAGPTGAVVIRDGAGETIFQVPGKK